ncbi:hypothetical protein EYF80_050655 [Liparis tanakae]|uniref:Uncharacterized protein n=1 Tax=Liparis tanakae TaxID=230148 RepID=A0A4Z2FFJ0_9TELE|nr:hypothetical protein EYF80_050655 [Liparis tanakae]
MRGHERVGVLRLSAGVFDTDPGLLNHVQVGPRHHQRGVAAEEKHKRTKWMLHLAMLHSGSMRCTVGSSMYSKVRLSLIRARSTLTLISTWPTPDREGAE